jgi:hypothetical protein
MQVKVNVIIIRKYMVAVLGLMDGVGLKETVLITMQIKPILQSVLQVT